MPLRPDDAVATGRPSLTAQNFSLESLYVMARATSTIATIAATTTTTQISARNASASERSGFSTLVWLRAVSDY